MRKTTQSLLLCSFLFMLGMLMNGITRSAEKQSTPVPQSLSIREVEFQGNIVCLLEEMHEHYNVQLFDSHQHLYGLKTEGGEYYTVLRTSLAEALFVDTRLHEKTLIIKGRVFPKTRLLEVVKFLSVRDGIVHELYYYCDTCYIRAVAPGNCDCCQAPVVLIEKPLNVDSTIPSP